MKTNYVSHLLFLVKKLTDMAVSLNHVDSLKVTFRATVDLLTNDD